MAHKKDRWAWVLVLAAVLTGCERKAEWSEDYAGVMMEIAVQNNLALVLIDGPGWNKPSEQLRRTLFSTAEFNHFVRQNNLRLIEAAIPNPRGKGVSPKRADELEKVIVQYGVEELPTVALSDSAGFAYAVAKGADSEKVMKTLREGLKFRKEFADQLAKADKEQGYERAQLLMHAREMLPTNWQDKYPGLNDAIIKSDPEDKTGLQQLLNNRRMVREQVEEVEKETSKRLGDLKGVTRLEALHRLRDVMIQLSGEKTWLPEVQCYIYKVTAACFLRERRISEGITYLQKAEEIYPDSPEVETLRREIERWEKAMRELEKSEKQTNSIEQPSHQ